MLAQQYSQSDPRWKAQLLGYNTDPRFNLGYYGCLVTAWANMMWWITGNAAYIPPLINNWLKGHKGFAPGGGMMYWSVALGMGHVQSEGTAANLAAVNQFLAADEANYAILEVRSQAGGQHFVFAPVVNKIVDSADGKLKAMSTYRFVSAHLYKAVGGQGSGSPAAASVPKAASTAVNNQEPVMSGQEEKEAYEVVLGREPEHTVPSGRTGMQFIRDAKAELDAQRTSVVNREAALRATIAELERQAGGAKTANSQLTKENQDLKTKLEAFTEPVKLTVADFEGSEIPEIRRRRVKGDHLMPDYSGRKEAYQLIDGMIFHQASTFLANGKVKVRTETSAISGDWYGADDDWFDDEPSTRARTVAGQDMAHLGASIGVGLAQRLGNMISGIINRKNKGIS